MNDNKHNINYIYIQYYIEKTLKRVLKGGVESGGLRKPHSSYENIAVACLYAMVS